ncbi:MAG TPA: MlaD family protein [Longimicrobiaceae bacterium]|jgi:phospholipid/cholesterol/gamma-HCH transport system substrate-binding protein|nr:MlaD family protein [Longimicrobiaceae bacterium]
MRLKNEVLVGMTVVAALVVLAGGGFWMSGRSWRHAPVKIDATFRAVGTLAKGNKVKYRGVEIGRVEEIQLAPRGDGVFVNMSIEPGLTFPPDAGVVLSPESFFGDWQAEIVSRSWQPDLQFTYAKTSGVLPGATLPDISELTAVAARIAGDIEVLSNRVQLAFTEETAVKIRRTIENAEAISEQLRGFMDQQTHTYSDVSRNVLASSANIRDATGTAKLAAADIRGTIGSGDVRTILANARQASENLNAFSTQLSAAAAGIPGLVTRADTTLGSINRTAQQAGQVMNTLGPQLQQVGPTLQEAQRAMQTLQQAMAKIQEGHGTLGRLIDDPALYEETQRAIVTLRRLLADLQANPGKYVGQVKVF